MSEFLKEFIYEVDWSEPWLLSLIAFHVLTAITILLVRHHTYIQAAILALLAVLCLSTEWINEYAALNYEQFSRQQYFDSSGLFISIVFSGPIIANCLLIVLCWFANAWQLLIKVGTLKARQGQKRSKQPTAAPQTDDKRRGDEGKKSR